MDKSMLMNRRAFSALLGGSAASHPDEIAGLIAEAAGGAR
jgi:hypothetical protein